MMQLAENKVASSEEGHLNYMGGLSFPVNHPVTRLRMMAATSFFKEPAFYPDTSTRDAILADPSLHLRLQATLGTVEDIKLRAQPRGAALERTIDDALTADAEATLKVAVALRQDDFIRVTPQVIMVRAAHHPACRGTGLVRAYGQHIMQRGDEPAVQLAYHNANFVREDGRPAPIPNALKKAWADFLANASEYTLGKYRMLKSAAKTVDVVNVCRPKSSAIGKLVNGQLKPQNTTWESFISEHGSTRETWHGAYETFLRLPGGHMALLRNLRNLESFGLVDSDVLTHLVNGAAGGKQLPFRYYSAYQAMKAAGAKPAVLAALEQCLHQSLSALPRLPGRVMSLADNSGSAHGTFTSEYGKVTVSSIANLTAVLTGFMASDEGWVGAFGDELERYRVNSSKSALEQHAEVQAVASKLGQGTENGVWLFFKEAIANREHWDHIFVYSDMQAGHGGLYGQRPTDYRSFGWPAEGGTHIDVPKLISTYRKEVNPNVMVYLVQMAGYSDTLVPEHYDKTVILGGWSGGVLRYAAKMHEVMGAPTRA
ncbi:TROVE domain-containing protein [Burkholderia cenocepacia]|uniref:TROVE domain-containing protein n=1 Tax=Burkholderia cenocepacia TaxID=95486 RepID=UPI000761D6C0|nr:TROVE domain-containing protein [Burkholderia cenocepacia]KWU19162.1 hypothetical protein AS149_13015 [Burkholderia cenocepacia]